MVPKISLSDRSLQSFIINPGPERKPIEKLVKKYIVFRVFTILVTKA